MTFVVELLKYIFLGIVQGVTEVLPISSSGHVALSQALLNINADTGILFLILVNLGSLIAIAYYFRTLLARLIVNSFRFIFIKSSRPESKEDFYYALKIVIATIPFGIMGVLFENPLDAFYQQYSLFVVAVGLLITSTFLYIVRFAPQKHVNQHLSFRDAIVIGLIQPFSMIPGLSRSGITTSTGLLRKISMDTALTFSLMLYIPISIGAFFYKLIPWFIDPAHYDIGFDTSNPLLYILYGSAFVFSILATRFSLKYIFKWFRQGKLIYFAVYTLILGLIALASAVISY